MTPSSPDAPLRGPHASQVALLIDFENLILGLRSSYDARVNYTFRIDPLLDLAAEYGHVVLANAYADWSHNLFADLRHKVYRRGVDLIHVMGKSEMKNAVDVKMAVDAIEFLFTLPQIRTFIVVSGDRDFIHMLKTLRRYGRVIIGVSPEASRSRDFSDLCDRFLTYQELMEKYARVPVDAREEPRLYNTEPLPPAAAAPAPAPVLTAPSAPEPPVAPPVAALPSEWTDVVEKLAKQYAFSTDRASRRALLQQVYQIILQTQPSTWEQIEERLRQGEAQASALTSTDTRRIRRALEQVGALEPLPDQDRKVRLSKRLLRLSASILQAEDLIRAYEAAVAALVLAEVPASTRSATSLALLLGYPQDPEGEALALTLMGALPSSPAPDSAPDFASEPVAASEVLTAASPEPILE